MFSGPTCRPPCLLLLRSSRCCFAGLGLRLSLLREHEHPTGSAQKATDTPKKSLLDFPLQSTGIHPFPRHQTGGQRHTHTWSRARPGQATRPGRMTSHANISKTAKLPADSQYNERGGRPCPFPQVMNACMHPHTLVCAASSVSPRARHRGKPRLKAHAHSWIQLYMTPKCFIRRNLFLHQFYLEKALTHTIIQNADSSLL